jgi:hypothetical protein
MARVDAELERSATARTDSESAAAGLVTRRAELASEIAGLESERSRLKGLIDERRRLEADKPRLESKVAATQRQYAALSAQYETIASQYPQKLLEAPERIRIIDAPKDPQIPETSRLFYLVFGVAASAIIGIGLAWAAEQTDPRLRDRHAFAAVAGVPVVAHLLGPAALGAKQRRSVGLWLGVLVVLILLALLAILAWLHFGSFASAEAVTRLGWAFVAEIASWFGSLARPRSSGAESFLSLMRG